MKEGVLSPLATQVIDYYTDGLIAAPATKSVEN